MINAFSVAVCERLKSGKITQKKQKKEKKLISVDPSGVVFRMIPLNTMTFNCLINSFSVEF